MIVGAGKTLNSYNNTINFKSRNISGNLFLWHFNFRYEEEVLNSGGGGGNRPFSVQLAQKYLNFAMIWFISYHPTGF